MDIIEILDLIDANVSPRLTGPLLAEALAALPPEEVERARPAARLRGLARLPDNLQAKHVELGLEPTDDEILMALEDPAADLKLIAQRVVLRMHLAPITEIEATARAIAAGPDPASTRLGKVLSGIAWFEIAMARLYLARDKRWAVDAMAPRATAFVLGGRVVPAIGRIEEGDVVAVLRAGQGTYDVVGDQASVMLTLRESDGVHAWAPAARRPEPGDQAHWAFSDCLRCALDIEHSHADPVGRILEILTKGPRVADEDFRRINEAVDLWDKLDDKGRGKIRGHLGGPRPDIAAINRGLADGTADCAAAAKQLSKWWAFILPTEFQASLGELLDGIETSHAKDQDLSTAAGRLQHEVLAWPLYAFAMARLARARKEAKERAKAEAREQDARVARILDRVEECGDGELAPGEEASLAADLAALDDAACGLAMRMWIGEEPTGIDKATEIASQEQHWDEYRDTILMYMILRPIEEARRIMAAIPGPVIPGLQGSALWRLAVARVKAAS